MVYTPPPSLDGLSLIEIAQLVEDRKLPPVERWSPEHIGESEMRIAADGRWFHQGGEITRSAMVRAFAGLLMRDSDGFWLVTPHQKLSIEVEDAPLIATDVVRKDGQLAFSLNTQEVVIAGPDNPVVARGKADRPAIYVTVRNGLEARLNRSTFEQLAQLAIEESGEAFTVSSGEATFSLVPQ